MEDASRYLSIVYLIAGLVLAWVCTKTLGLVFYAVSPAADVIVFAGIRLSVVLGVLIGFGIVYGAWRHERFSTYLSEVVTELTRVTWPARDETYRNTYVVIGFSLLVAIFLALFDLVWKFATDALLSV